MQLSDNNNTLIINHSYGFFSCCSVRLHFLIEYFNHFHHLPLHIDTSKQFDWYKKDDEKDIDITYEYFEYPNNVTNDSINMLCNKQSFINYLHTHQYENYRMLDYNVIPFIKKYFTPSEKIINIQTYMEKKYNLNYDNLCVIFYRGNDKATETKLGSYGEYINRAKEIKEKEPNIQFLIQTDELEFLEKMLEIFPNSIYFKDEIRVIPKQISTVDIVLKQSNSTFSKYYLAITLIMAKCKYIICGSGNCSIWIIFYREHSNNVIQFNNDIWIS